MFYSIVKRVGGVLINIPTTDELQFARNFGHVMHLWAYGSYSMEDAVHKKQEVPNLLGFIQIVPVLRFVCV
jgi:hypothetical protein